jgi:hypothetical protein
MNRLVIAAIAVTMMVAVACGTSPVTEGSTIDGWSVGAAYTCIDTDPERPCSALLPFAQKRLDQRDPVHLPVVASELRSQGPDHPTHTGTFFIAVFTLADGSHNAIMVTYPEVATYLWTKDYGP